MLDLSNTPYIPRIESGEYFLAAVRIVDYLSYLCHFFYGINDLTRQYLEANKDTLNYVGIIPADFPGTGLIDAIIAVNF